MVKPVSTQAANYSCGEEKPYVNGYYYKYNTKGLYKSKDKKNWKLIKKVKNEDTNCYDCYDFTTNGTYIYYGVYKKRSKKQSKKLYDPKHIVIYRIKTNGKGNKKVYNARHLVSISYFSGNKLVYVSDVDGNGTFWDEEPLYCVDIKTKKFTKITDDAAGVGYASGNYIVPSYIPGEISYESGKTLCDDYIHVYDLKRLKMTDIGWHTSPLKLTGGKEIVLTHEESECDDAFEDIEYGKVLKNNPHYKTGFHVKVAQFDYNTGTYKVLYPKLRIKYPAALGKKYFKYYDFKNQLKTIKIK